MLSPTTITSDAATYNILEDTLLAHLQSQRLELTERAVFYAILQRDGESIASFFRFSWLKKAVEFCNFGATLDSMLRDRLALGCGSPAAKKKLLTIENLTLKAAQDNLAVFEAVESAQYDAFLGQSPHPSGIDHACARKKVSRLPPSTAPSVSSSLCPRCGNGNCLEGRKCVAFGKKCSNCGKSNHFKKVCRSRSLKPQYVGAVEKDLMHVDALGSEVLPTHSVTQLLHLTVNDKDVIAMEIDTEAAATLISERMWRSLGSPELQLFGKMFSAYDGHRMKPLGEFRCSITHREVTVDAAVSVIHSSKLYGLLGRDLIPELLPSAPVHNLPVGSYVAIHVTADEGGTCFGRHQ